MKQTRRGFIATLAAFVAGPKLAQKAVKEVTAIDLLSTTCDAYNLKPRCFIRGIDVQAGGKIVVGDLLYYGPDGMFTTCRNSCYAAGDINGRR